MRISDWSSDVCSSDLPAGGRRRRRVRIQAGPLPQRPRRSLGNPERRAPGGRPVSAPSTAEAPNLSAECTVAKLPDYPVMHDRFCQPQEIGRAHVCTPLTTALLLCLLLLENKTQVTNPTHATNTLIAQQTHTN